MYNYITQKACFYLGRGGDGKAGGVCMYLYTDLHITEELQGDTMNTFAALILILIVILLTIIGLKY